MILQGEDRLLDLSLIRKRVNLMSRMSQMILMTPTTRKILTKRSSPSRTRRTMKNLIRRIILSLSLNIPANAREDGQGWSAGFGFVISPDYNSTLKDNYDDVSGGYGWLHLNLGYSFVLMPRLQITPNAGLLMNFVSGDDSFVNTIILPALAFRYAFTEYPSVYIGAEVNYGNPNIGGNRIDADSDGVGFGGYLGYANDARLGLELGYLHIPVEVNKQDSENFGGFVLRTLFTF